MAKRIQFVRYIAKTQTGRSSPELRDMSTIRESAVELRDVSTSRRISTMSSMGSDMTEDLSIDVTMQDGLSISLAGSLVQ